MDGNEIIEKFVKPALEQLANEFNLDLLLADDTHILTRKRLSGSKYEVTDVTVTTSGETVKINCPMYGYTAKQINAAPMIFLMESLHGGNHFCIDGEENVASWFGGIIARDLRLGY